MAGEKITLSVIKADVGSYVGHVAVHPELMEEARVSLGAAQKEGLIIDFHVTRCGDDLELIMTHRRGEEDKDIHGLAWDTFQKCTSVAKSLKLYGAGQDLLSDAFSGNVKGMGPGVAELEFVERKSEPIVVFMADKTAPGAWNLPLYKMFADPFNTIGLVIDPTMHDGFDFMVLDTLKNTEITFHCPDEIYSLLIFLGTQGRYMVRRVIRRRDGEVGAVASTQRLSLIAGKYVGKDDPVLIVRSQAGFPAVGEVLEAFSFPGLAEGWMRGSHYGPLMPVKFAQANPSRFDGPPRVIAAGFQLNNGHLVGPVDLFDDPSFDDTRRRANEAAEYLRRHGPFEPHRLPLDEMEYTTMPILMEKLKDRFKPLD